MRIDRTDPADEPDDSHADHRAQSVPDDPNTADKHRGTEDSGDGLPDSSRVLADSGLRAELSMAYRAKVDAAHRRPGLDYGQVRESEAAIPGIRPRQTEGPDASSVGRDAHQKVEGKLAEASELSRVEMPRAPGGDFPDDPRNHSNPKTGRIDASWSVYDRAIAAAREHSGGDLGPDSIKMYDYSPKAGEGTGTLIGEQSPDRLRGWRIDGQDGHVNWWDWTEGKKGSGGVFGHDWFPEDPSAPGSRYIGWAPWQDSDGNILEGN